MAATKMFRSEMKDKDIEELLSKLTEDELEELHMELIDPDDSMVPPSDRCRYKTDKLPSGPFDRKKLLDFLEKKAKEEKDWDDARPYSKETRGKVYKPKEIERVVVNDNDVPLETEWDDALSAATEEELVDLAAVLGFHGMLNQVQYHHAFVSGGGDMKLTPGGFQGVAKSEPCKTFEIELPNQTNVSESVKKLSNNDPSLTELNLNNIKDISTEQLCELASALKTNTHLQKLHFANTRATDKVARAMADALTENKTLTLLNLESNYISGQAIVDLLTAINVNQVVSEFRVVNQRPQVLGVKNEMQIAQLTRENKSLLQFGIFLEVRGAQVIVSESIQRNNDNVRRKRVGEEIILPPVPQVPYYLKNNEVKKTDEPQIHADETEEAGEPEEGDEE